MSVVMSVVMIAHQEMQMKLQTSGHVWNINFPQSFFSHEEEDEQKRDGELRKKDKKDKKITSIKWYSVK